MDVPLPTNTDDVSETSSIVSEGTIQECGLEEINDWMAAHDIAARRYDNVLLGGILPGWAELGELSLYRGLSLLQMRMRIRRIRRMWIARDETRFPQADGSRDIERDLADREAMFDHMYQAGEYCVDQVIAILNNVARQIEEYEEERRRHALLAQAPEQYLDCVDSTGPGEMGDSCFGCREEMGVEEATITHEASTGSGRRCQRVFHKACLNEWWLRCSGLHPEIDTLCPFCRMVVYRGAPLDE